MLGRKKVFVCSFDIETANSQKAESCIVSAAHKLAK